MSKTSLATIEGVEALELMIRDVEAAEPHAEAHLRAWIDGVALTGPSAALIVMGRAVAEYRRGELQRDSLELQNSD